MTDEIRDTAIRITDQGAVRVNCAYIHKDAYGMACIYLDLHSKYAVAETSISGGNAPPCIWLSANSKTMHLDDSKPLDHFTCIEFSDYPGWRVFAADANRYTVSVCLVKD